MKNTNTAPHAAQLAELLTLLEDRFHQHMERHAGLLWSDVVKRLEASPAQLAVLWRMEHTEGEPDVVGKDAASGAFIFYDCSAESPKGRRSLCYDRAALDARKANKPESCVLDVAKEIGVNLLSEDDYRFLQGLGEFDLKTSSWVATPDEIRKRGGALFCDRRYGQVFTYHNGADSYYGARGFRGSLIV
ncbi:DUF4256 domain-containing protein [Sphingobacterium griseoflavum]|uniref:DUF4256 domain-containing protein n=1 Tax=Sphingobacterium griseoflavum TaxID=1474952 RepID=A0ABQ3HRN7_9SPHI|nr:DUF4256 domain-containing protein [Sphingobacterium griseoflavum]GHE28573.1 hypothetical protein GCM10017764_08810 [Sphingobacterium griseoflavum]